MRTDWPEIEGNVNTTADINGLSEEIWHLAEELGFDHLSRAEIDGAFREIATNSLHFAQSAHVSARSVNSGRILNLEIADQGPGIPNLDQNAWNGLGRHRCLGRGINRARRLVDRMLIRSQPSEGTLVTLEKFVPLPAHQVGYGILSIPRNEARYNGDSYVLKEMDGDKIAMAVVSINQYTEISHLLTELIAQVVQRSLDKPLLQVVAMCQNALRNLHIPVECSLCVTCVTNDHIDYFCFGDVHAYLIENGSIQPLLRQTDLTLNDHVQVTAVQTHRVDRNADEQKVILCTAGISRELEQLVFANGMDTQQAVNLVFDRCHVPDKDSTVLMATLKEPSFLA